MSTTARSTMASISPEESPASSSPARPIRFSLCAVSLACSVVTSAVPPPPSGSSSPVTRSDEPPSVVTMYDSSVALGCCTRTWGGWTVCSSSRPVSTSKCGSCLLVHKGGLRRPAPGGTAPPGAAERPRPRGLGADSSERARPPGLVRRCRP